MKPWEKGNMFYYTLSLTLLKGRERESSKEEGKKEGLNYSESQAVHL